MEIKRSQHHFHHARIDDHFIAHWLVEINDVAKEFTYEEWIEHGEKWIRHVAPKQDLSVAS